MRILKLMGIAASVLTVTAFAGSASGVNWHCTQTIKDTNYSILVTPSFVTIASCSAQNPKALRVIGGPYKNLQIFGTGEFLGVQSKSGTFSMNSGSLSASLNAGMGHLDLSDVSCR